MFKCFRLMVHKLWRLELCSHLYSKIIWKFHLSFESFFQQLSKLLLKCLNISSSTWSRKLTRPDRALDERDFVKSPLETIRPRSTWLWMASIFKTVVYLENISSFPQSATHFSSLGVWIFELVVFTLWLSNFLCSNPGQNICSTCLKSGFRLPSLGASRIQIRHY